MRRFNLRINLRTIRIVVSNTQCCSPLLLLYNTRNTVSRYEGGNATLLYLQYRVAGFIHAKRMKQRKTFSTTKYTKKHEKKESEPARFSFVSG